jgi:hypothetical protein
VWWGAGSAKQRAAGQRNAGHRNAGQLDANGGRHRRARRHGRRTPLDAGIDSAIDGIEASVDAGIDASLGQACPDEIGTYTVVTSGAGCSDLVMSAVQSITPGASACQVQLVSAGAGGSALNGTITLDSYGNFAGGAVKEGTVQRTGCTGVWSAGMSQLTVDCGGMMTSQSCVALLTRTGTTCP